MTRRPLLRDAMLAAGLGMMGALSIFRMWRHAVEPTPGRIEFGLDLIAYTNAAGRLIETGTPYHPLLRAGPIVNTGSNVPIGYFYPPPLAQAFVPLVSVPHYVLAVIWTLAQIAVLVWLFPALYRRAGGSLTVGAVLGLLLLGVSSWPLNVALFIGNVSGWIAIGAGLLLLLVASAAGRVAAVMALVKLTPVVFLLAALAGRRTARAALLTATFAFGVSFVLSPEAWVDYMRVLPNILRIAPADRVGNLAPAVVLIPYGLGPLGTMLGWAMAVGFGLVAVLSARRSGSTLATVVAAAASMCFVSGTMWTHYLAVMVPLMVFAWPGADVRRQAIIVAYSAWGITSWIGALDTDETQLVMLALLVALIGELSLRPWPFRTSPAGSPALSVE